MSLPTKTNLQTLDYAWRAEPFVSVVAKTTISTAGLDYALGAEPFVAMNGAASGSGQSILRPIIAT